MGEADHTDVPGTIVMWGAIGVGVILEAVVEGTDSVDIVKVAILSGETDKVGTILGVAVASGAARFDGVAGTIFP